MNSIKSVLAVKSFYRTNSNNVNSSDSSIELPEEIKKLNTGSDYWKKAKANRYKKLMREGHRDDLMQLAEIATKKKNPDFWFAKVCSKANWERTLKFLSKLREAAKVAAEVARRISVPVEHMKAVYAAYWRHGAAIIRHAVTAEETARDGQFKYFCWLTRKNSEKSYCIK